jgi:hypothetical protein
MSNANARNIALAVFFPHNYRLWLAACRAVQLGRVAFGYLLILRLAQK